MITGPSEHRIRGDVDVDGAKQHRRAVMGFEPLLGTPILDRKDIVAGDRIQNFQYGASQATTSIQVNTSSGVELSAQGSGAGRAGTAPPDRAPNELTRCLRGTDSNFQFRTRQVAVSRLRVSLGPIDCRRGGIIRTVVGLGKINRAVSAARGAHSPPLEGARAVVGTSRN